MPDCRKGWALLLASLACAFFSAGLASGSKVKAVTPALLDSSSIFFSASSAVTELSGSREASIAPCSFNSSAACSVAIVTGQSGCRSSSSDRGRLVFYPG